MSNNVARQVDSRRNQKDRTRAAIVAAATDQLRDGMNPTVAGAAEAAKVSRATAYRYFPTQEALLSETATITPSLVPVEAALGRWTTEAPQDRLNTLLDLFNPIVVENEISYRAALRLYLETWFGARLRDGDLQTRVRAGRRMRWLEDVLQPLKQRMPAPLSRRLKNALALTMGIDSIVVMKDVCGLETEEALNVLRWAAGIILEGAIREAEGRRKSRRN
jgi:AcrR family transcriptional regulator